MPESETLTEKTKLDTVTDFMGNEYGVGDHVYYCPTNRYAGLVHATVVGIGPPHGPNRRQGPQWIVVQPNSEARWTPGKADDRSKGRRVTLTNLHRIVMESKS